ncbi:Apolipoprotein N-acyltransferase [Rickettsiales bacterium Ac37b]|nr:Apolipoprotein N-acyltransferase [Rickettsiales bacterium Ac37b]
MSVKLLPHINNLFNNKFYLYLLLVVVGMLSALSLPPCFYTFLNFITFPVLYYFTTVCTNKVKAFVVGWWFGFGYFILGLYWFAHALLIEADKFSWLIPFANLGIPSLLAIYIGLTTWSFYILLKLIPRITIIGKLLTFSSIWMIFEWLRGHLFTGFPWNLIGYSWANDPSMLQVTSIFGIYGLSFLTTLLSTSPIILLEHKKHYYKFICIGVVGLITYYAGYQRLVMYPTEFNDTVPIRIVQANIPQNLKWQPNILLDNIMSHINLSKEYQNNSQIRYIIWPESAVPYPINNDSLLQLLAPIIPSDGLLLTGSIRVIGKGKTQKWWNSLSAINAKGQIIGYYDKTHLVPFGEYVPFRSILPIEKIAYGLSDWERGNGQSTLYLSDNLPLVSPLVCYEVIFPHEVTDNSHRAEWLLNVTNDGWYGQSFGPYQHFYIALVRTVEEGIPLVRAANTGISAIIDSYGRIVSKLSLGTEGIIDGLLPLTATSITIYSKYGDIMLLSILLLNILYVFSIKKKKVSN